MDWATFIKDNSQSLFTLAGVFLGSIITFVISYLNNRFQAKEKDKDREEQRREAKIQSKEKWIERDILKMMDALEKMLRLLADSRSWQNQHELLTDGKSSGVLTQQELVSKLRSVYDKVSNMFSEVSQIGSEIFTLVDSFEETEIVSSYAEFSSKLDTCLSKEIEYMQNKLNPQPLEESAREWDKVSESAGKFHRALRNKLISIRE